MAETYEILIKGGTVVNQDGVVKRDIAVSDGRIAALGDIAAGSAGEVIDAAGLTIIPGVIDSQVHFREPGLTHKEDLETGSRGAVLGGVTTVFEMPNTNPSTTTPERLGEKVAAAHHRMFCDFAFYVGGTEDNVEDIPELERLPGSAGIKVFIGSSTGTLLVDNPAVLDRIIQKISRRAAFHAEDEGRLIQRKDLRVAGDPSSHPVWRDEIAALMATRQLVGLAEKHNKRVHVLHISTAVEMEFLSAHKEWASVEVTPHHLSLVAPDCYERLGTYCQMNPPVRDAKNQAGIWAGIANGVVDVLGSDHAPHTREEKDHTYPDSHSGMTGVQTLLPIMLDHVAAGRLSLERLVDLTSHGPQRLFGMRGKGRIAVGYDADLAIVDLKRTETITNAQVASRAGWTPYDGREVTGWPVGTFVRGRRVMWEGEIIGPASGEAARFFEGG
ncbi:MAG: dihydroorotase [Alphaproteobacteria bacterium BRH_c36]|nr:MAG: dihydroorotase [Alphaproteobacteria bacterium BRH_c36]